MIVLRTRGPVLLLAALSFSLVPARMHATPVASYSFTWDGAAPDDTRIRVAGIGFGLLGIPIGFDFTIDLSGNDKNEAMKRLRDQLRDRNVDIDEISPSSTDMKGISLGGGVVIPITIVIGAGSKKGFTVSVDGREVDIRRGMLTDKWSAAFQPGLASDQGVTEAGDLVLSIPGLTPLRAPLAAGSTPLDAALVFASLLRDSGFPGVEIASSGTEVFFLETPSGQTIDSVSEFSFTGANLTYQLRIPTAVPEPSSFGMLLVSGLGGMTLYLGPRRRFRQRKGAVP